ncbi:hypothetical protein OHA25_17245 [Nonomuraea sp. NBC_00507]|uniref:hypothetical protein n=1 Tax=Nonomuraea sp. NBC_00507 TaxID=2976002 RepID=UPI002E18E148
MQLQATPAAGECGKSAAVLELVHTHMSSSNRRAYLLRAAEALAAGDLASLPVIASVWRVPVGDLCKDCHGTGFLSWSARSRGGVTVCACMPDVHPGFDVPRFTREEVGSRLRYEYPDEGARRVFTLCRSCSVAPADLDVEVGAVVVPWVPDCTVCGDTGWERVDDRLTMSLTRPERKARVRV